MAIELDTERLLLRPFRDADLDRLAEYQAMPEVALYMYWEPSSRPEVKAMMARWMEATRLEQDDDVVTLAVERREDGLLLGSVTIFLRSAEFRQVEVGYVFHPDAGGQGYATEATRALIDYAFDALGAHRVFARTDARNTPSAALLLRLGMREEAHFREAKILKGDWGDELVFAVLDREWRTDPPLTAGPA
jgi:RimJ/RimL family protein N-acetyltransferase